MLRAVWFAVIAVRTRKKAAVEASHSSGTNTYLVSCFLQLPNAILSR